jgi:hypothetical protein
MKLGNRQAMGRVIIITVTDLVPSFHERAERKEDTDKIRKHHGRRQDEIRFTHGHRAYSTEVRIWAEGR